MLAKALGVHQLVVVVNKMDEVHWSEKRFKEIKETLSPYLQTACGWDLDKIIWVPIAGLLGENMKEPIKHANASWYKGPTLFEVFDAIEPPQRDEKGPIRIPVLDKYKEAGAVYIFGKVESGTIVPGTQLVTINLNR
jgi:Translation elongation factor EF-1alpha (GTPase)